MSINVDTKYTKERLLRFNTYHTLSKKPLWIIMAICHLIIIGSIVFSAVLVGEFPWEMMKFIILMAYLDILLIVCYFIVPRLTVKKARSLNATIHFLFEDEGMKIESEVPNATESSTIKYPFIVKVARKNTELYLYISPRQAYIVDLSELSHEDTEQIRSLLEAHVPKKKFKW